MNNPNPMMLLKMKQAWETFTRNHPKFPLFWKTVYNTALKEGTILEFKVTTPEGKELTSNMRICQDDLELLKQIREIAGQ